MTGVAVRDGIAVVTFDDPGAKVVVVSEALLGELRAALEGLRGDAAVKGVLLASAKPDCFLAGADLKAMAAMQREPDPQARGTGLSRMGQAFMAFVDDFPKPVAAAIGGTCLGGGTELALACDYRIASDHEKTRIGLPEVKLGILPGWGGTVRLPETVGVAKALDLMLTGRELAPREALKRGLVDAVAPATGFLEDAHGWFARTLAGGGAAVHERRGAARGFVSTWLTDPWPPVRWLVGALARRSVVQKTRGAYPAPLAITRVVGARGFGDRATAFAREANALGELIATPVARNLLGVFFLTQEAKGAGSKAEPRPVARAGVVGGGLMGGGIATVFANRLIPVRLKDMTAADVGKGLKTVGAHFAGQAKRRRLTPVAARDRVDAVSGGTTWEGFRCADLVVEAVPEVLAIKQGVYDELEGVVRRDAVICSNTSTIPISTLSNRMKSPERFVGMHFFFPAPHMPLVEVIPSAKSSPEAVATVVALARRCGKTAIVVKDAPGFLVNRILMPYMLEAYHLLEEGATVAAVDGAALGYGMPMGPVRLTGEVGIAVAHKAGAVILESFKDRLEAPKLPEAMAGVKNAFLIRGRDKLPNVPVIEALARGAGKPARVHAPEEIRDRLILAMANEACWCLGEEIVASPGLLDLSLIMGIGFPPFRGGICRWVDETGPAEVLGRVERLAVSCGRRFSPAPFLADLARSGRRLIGGATL